MWPVILDSQPPYLRGRGRSGSLLLAPFGTSTLLEHLMAALANVTNPPLVLATEGSDPQYSEWITALCPKARVITDPQRLAQVVAGFELSDAMCIVDPRCMPARGFQFSELLQQHAAEPRVAHHLVSFQSSLAGTKERVSFDGTGQIRSIQRHYEQATWSRISDITASVVPCASGVLADGRVPRTLAELRQILTVSGVPSRDLPIEGGALNLGEEGGMLAANEPLVIRAVNARAARDGHVTALHVGDGQRIHATARILGPVVVHADAHIDDGATVLGPAVIGAGARIGSGAVIAHATIGPDGVVPPGRVVRDRAWFVNDGAALDAESDRSTETAHGRRVTFAERLERLTLDAETREAGKQETVDGPDASWTLALKRAMDIIVSGTALLLLSPVFALVALAVWLESGGPIFYGDKREGLGGRVFYCWKYRTMFTGAHLAQMDLKGLDQTDGPHFKMERDPRVTKVGRVLRMLNLDEVPQLFNVLRGEMSLVGPRPSPFRENQVCVPWREARLSVRPGITGFWQVCRHNRAAGDFHQWIEYDLLYVQHLSLWLDIKILAATLFTLGGKAKHVQAPWLVGAHAVSASDRSSDAVPSRQLRAS